MIYKKIAIFASGSGTNAENISRFFLKNEKAKVALILSNRKVVPASRTGSIAAYSFSRLFQGRSL